MRHTRLALAAIAALALGCGDGDGGDGADAAAGFTVVLAPDTGEPLWTGDAVRVMFSAPAAAASIDADSAVVRGPAGALAASRELSADGLTLSIRLDEVPALPATMSFELTDAITSTDGRALEPASFELAAPLWYRAPRGEPDASSPAIAALADGRLLVAGIEGGGVFAGDGGDLRFDSATGQAVRGRVLLRRAGDAIVLGYLAGGEVQVVDLAADPPALATVPGADGADALGLALDAGAAVVAWHDGDGIEVARQSAGDWQALGPALAVDADWVDLASTSAGLLLAHGSAAGVSVLRWDGSAWVALGPVLDPAGSAPVLSAEAGAAPHLAWLSGGSAQVASWDGAAWQRLGALELDPEHLVQAPPALATDRDGNLWASWVETGAHGGRAYVARWDGARWRVQGSAVTDGDASATALAIDDGGHPAVAVAPAGAGEPFSVARWNRSPALPYGELGGDASGCQIPSNPAALLSDTGCYADTAAGELAAGAVPYSVRAPLWSDGAFKRRAFILPEGESVGYAATGPWAWPVGAILIKEFWLERVEGDPRSRFPVETRFWVKRCDYGDCIEPWQGYSYQWNQDGTDAALLDGFTAARVDWPVTAGGEEVTRTYLYPSRFDCIRCHAREAGYVLGPRAGQLAGSHDYGNTVDLQLRTLAHAGVFGDSLDAEGALAAVAWPAPGDPGAPLAGRVRAYLHSNCAHCHKRDLSGDEQPGEAPVMDLRVSTPLADTGLCDMVAPGDPEGSRLHEVLATRGAGQMPPLATDQVDAAQLATTAAWIEEMTTCP